MACIRVVKNKSICSSELLMCLDFWTNLDFFESAEFSEDGRSITSQPHHLAAQSIFFWRI